jgi:hypothetical protein
VTTAAIAAVNLPILLPGTVNDVYEMADIFCFPRRLQLSIIDALH